MRILFTGGGSGGHITPIVAVARQLKGIYKDNLQMFFLGAPKFSYLLEKEGIKVKKITAGKIRRVLSPQNILKNTLDIFKMPFGILQALWRLFHWMPDVIFSKGGYGSVPVVLVAWLYRIPVLIHDSDVIPGLANRFAAKFAKSVAVSFAETAKYFPPKKVAFLGIPIRLELVEKCLSNTESDREQAKKIFEIVSQKPVVFIIGGSQGGKKINEMILGALDILLKKYEIIHQCGKESFKHLSKIVGSNLPQGYHLLPFLNETEMAAAFLLADLVISRAGATSIFEIAACHKPSILIPIPNSASGHQRENAFAYARSGGAIVIEQQNLSPHLFLKQISDIIENPEISQKLMEGAKNFAKLDASEKIAQVLIEMGK